VQLNPRKTGVRRAAGMIFLCGILLAPILRAQSYSSSARQEEEQPRFLKRFSVGVRASILTMDLLSSATNTATPNAETVVAQTLTPANLRLGGGVTVEYAASRRVLVSVDLLYHYFSYSADTTTNVSLPDGTSQITDVSEGLHARYYDLPIVFRYATLPARTASARVFLGVGPDFRTISDIRTATTTTNADGSQVFDYTPRVPQNRVTYGVVAVAGFRVKDDFGIKVTPEVRYTRWLSSLFDGWPAQQRRNELQVVIGLTF
jgi:hypothetical protein